MSRIEGQMIKVTNGLSVGGVSMPVWWPNLEQVSNMAVQLVPILSAVWLTVQIVLFVAKHMRAWRASRRFAADEGGAMRARYIGGGILAAVLALGLPITAKWEGKENVAYWDRYGQVWTVCFGETEGVQRGDRYTDQECADMLGDRWVEFHASLAGCIGEKFVKAPIEVQGALTSWAYNVGTGAACRSTLARHMRAGNYRAACDQLPRWRRAGGQVLRGLINRRADERALCLSGLP